MILKNNLEIIFFLDNFSSQHHANSHFDLSSINPLLRNIPSIFDFFPSSFLQEPSDFSTRHLHHFYSIVNAHKS